MTVLGRGRSSLVYLIHIHVHNYNDDAIITIQNILTEQISIKIKKKTNPLGY